MPLGPVTYFVKLCCYYTFILSPCWGEFNYDEKSEKGLSRLGEIQPKWSMCGRGTMQSPIDLLNKRVEVISHLERLKRSNRPAYAKRERKGLVQPHHT